MYNVGMPTKGKTAKRPVKSSVNATLGTMPFFQGRVRLKIAQSKFPLRLPTYNTFFPKRVGMKITQSKVALTIQKGTKNFSLEGGGRKSPSRDDH